MLNRTKLLLATTALVATVPRCTGHGRGPRGFAGTRQWRISDLGERRRQQLLGRQWLRQPSVLAPNFGGQLDGGYHNLSDDGGDADLFDVGGSLFWAPGMARAGARSLTSPFDLDGFGFDLNVIAPVRGVRRVLLQRFLHHSALMAAAGAGEAAGFDSDGFYIGGRRDRLHHAEPGHLPALSTSWEMTLGEMHDLGRRCGVPVLADDADFHLTAGTGNTSLMVGLAISMRLLHRLGLQFYAGGTRSTWSATATARSAGSATLEAQTDLALSRDRAFTDIAAGRRAGPA